MICDCITYARETIEKGGSDRPILIQGIWKESWLISIKNIRIGQHYLQVLEGKLSVEYSIDFV